MNKIHAIGTVNNGKLKLDKQEEFTLALKCRKDERVLLTIETLHNKRSTKQNSSNYGIAEKILRELFSESFGYDVSKEKAHILCMENCLPEDYVEQLKEEYNSCENEVVSNITGLCKKQPFVLTTAKMTTVQSNQYYVNMQLFALEYFAPVDQKKNIIPDPDPDYKNKLPIEKL